MASNWKTTVQFTKIDSPAATSSLISDVEKVRLKKLLLGSVLHFPLKNALGAMCYIFPWYQQKVLQRTHASIRIIDIRQLTRCKCITKGVLWSIDCCHFIVLVRKYGFQNPVLPTLY